MGAGSRNAAEPAQPQNVRVVVDRALRLLHGHGFDRRVDVGAMPLGGGASMSRKAMRKKSRSTCWRPITRSSSAIRALAAASSPPGRAATGALPGEGGARGDARPGGEPDLLAPGFGPRLRFNPATPSLR